MSMIGRHSYGNKFRERGWLRYLIVELAILFLREIYKKYIGMYYILLLIYVIRCDIKENL